MIRRWSGVCFVVVLAGLALAACSGKNGGGKAGGSGCGGGASTTGHCSGVAACEYPPCPQGCTLQISVVAGFPDTCTGGADACDTFPDEEGCAMQGCLWSGGGDGGESCGSDGGDGYVDSSGGGMRDVAAYEGTCSGKGGIACSSFSPPNCQPEDNCFSQSDFDAGLMAMVCAGEGRTCSYWSSTSQGLGDPASCRQNGCTWTPE
jgi:hypothetical protein